MLCLQSALVLRMPNISSSQKKDINRLSYKEQCTGSSAYNIRYAEQRAWNESRGDFIYGGRGHRPACACHSSACCACGTRSRKHQQSGCGQGVSLHNKRVLWQPVAWKHFSFEYNRQALGKQ